MSFLYEKGAYYATENTRYQPKEAYLYKFFSDDGGYPVCLSAFVNKVPEASSLKGYKIFGDAYIQQKLVNRQLVYSIGHSMISRLKGFNNRDRMMLEWAIDEMRRLGLTPGKPLTLEQQRQLKRVIIWPELHWVDGLRVLFPKVYVTEEAAAEFRYSSSIIIGNTVDWGMDSLELGLGDAIEGREGVKIRSKNVSTDEGARISSAEGVIDMDIKDTLKINNARMSAESLLLQAKNRRSQADKDRALEASSGNVHIKTKKDLIAAVPIFAKKKTIFDVGGDAAFFAQFESFLKP